MKLALCGLGLMGAPLAQRLLAAGHELRVWNRSPAKAQALVAAGAVACATPAEAAQGVDGVLLCLLDAPAVEQVVFGPDGLTQTAGWQWLVDHSSINPDTTRELAQRLQAGHGTQWLDAPVSGGVAGAEAGQLAVMVGGDAALLAQLEGTLRAYAANVTWMGPVGAGQTAKLCNQVIVSACVAAVAEALSLARQAGVQADRLPAAFAGGWADSPPLRVFAPRMLQAPTNVLGTVATMLKDVDTVMAQAQARAVPMPVTANVQQTLRQAVAMGLAEADLSAVVCVSHPASQADFLKG